MSDNEIESTVKEIVAEQLDATLGDLTKDTSFTDDLQADSLAIVELVLALEEKFGVKIPDEEVDRIRNIGNVVDYIKKAQNKDG